MGSRGVVGRGGRIAIVLLVAAAMVAQASAAVQNDAGSGTDAPDTMEDALYLKAPGTYTGNFTSVDVKDWYKVKLKDSRHDPVCVSSRFVSEALLDGHVVAVSGDSATEAVGKAAPLRTNYRAVASDGFTGGFLGASPQSAPGSLVKYDFTLVARGQGELPSPDAGTGKDAGNTTATATSITSPCVGGILDPASGDTTDVFSFDGQLGDRFLFSLSEASDLVTTTLRAPSGALLDTITGTNLTAVKLPETGTYTLTTSTSSADTSYYVLALCGPDCGPPEDPCHPMCTELVASTS